MCRSYHCVGEMHCTAYDCKSFRAQRRYNRAWLRNNPPGILCREEPETDCVKIKEVELC